MDCRFFEGLSPDALYVCKEFKLRNTVDSIPDKVINCNALEVLERLEYSDVERLQKMCQIGGHTKEYDIIGVVELNELYSIVRSIAVNDK